MKAVWHWAPGLPPQSDMNLLQMPFRHSLRKCLSLYCSVHCNVQNNLFWWSGVLASWHVHWKKWGCLYVCLTKSISECSCCFWILFSDYSEFCHFEIMCWIFSATKNLSRSVSYVWPDLFWFIISHLVDFIPSSRNEIETKISSFKNAGMGPFLIQEARWSDTYFSKTILTLSIWESTILHFLIHFGFHFYIEFQVLFLENGAFNPLTHCLFLSEEKDWFLLFLLFQGLCSHWVNLSLFRCNVLERWGPNCYQSSSQERKQCELSGQLKGKHGFYLTLNVSFLITN